MHFSVGPEIRPAGPGKRLDRCTRLFRGWNRGPHKSGICVRGRATAFHRESARNVLARLDGSIETIKNREVLARLEKVRADLRTLLESGKTALPWTVRL